MAPQNPLKPERGMAPRGRRIAAAAALARHPRIRVLDLEARLETRYTADTLDALHRAFPAVRFVWLMGADNLIQIRHWQRWQEIFERTLIAVFARPAYCHKALASLPAQRFARARVGAEAARQLVGHAPPAWVFLPVRLDPLSASDIRARGAQRRTRRAVRTRQTTR